MTSSPIAEAEALAACCAAISPLDEAARARVADHLFDMFCAKRQPPAPALKVVQPPPKPPAQDRRKSKTSARHNAPHGLFMLSHGRTMKHGGPAMEATLAFIREKGPVTKRSVMERFGVAYESARQRIDHCLRAGLIAETKADRPGAPSTYAAVPPKAEEPAPEAAKPEGSE